MYGTGRSFTLLVPVGSPGKGQVLAVSGLCVSVTKSIMFSMVSQMCVGQWECRGKAPGQRAGNDCTGTTHWFRLCVWWWAGVGGGDADLKNDFRLLWPPIIHKDAESHRNNQRAEGNS